MVARLCVDGWMGALFELLLLWMGWWVDRTYQPPQLLSWLGLQHHYQPAAWLHCSELWRTGRRKDWKKRRDEASGAESIVLAFRYVEQRAEAQEDRQLQERSTTLFKNIASHNR